jgi:hypothetical protein
MKQKLENNPLINNFKLRATIFKRKIPISSQSYEAKPIAKFSHNYNAEYTKPSSMHSLKLKNKLKNVCCF